MDRRHNDIYTIANASNRFKFTINTFGIAVYLYDSYNQIAEISDYDSLIVACVFAACKFEELQYPKIADFKLGNKEQICAYEIDIICKLSLFYKTSYVYLQEYLEKYEYKYNEIYIVASKLITLALYDDVCSKFNPAILAETTLIIALKEKDEVFNINKCTDSCSDSYSDSCTDSLSSDSTIITTFLSDTKYENISPILNACILLIKKLVVKHCSKKRKYNN